MAAGRYLGLDTKMCCRVRWAAFATWILSATRSGDEKGTVSSFPMEVNSCTHSTFDTLYLLTRLCLCTCAVYAIRSAERCPYYLLVFLANTQRLAVKPSKSYVLLLQFQSAANRACLTAILVTRMSNRTDWASVFDL